MWAPWVVGGYLLALFSFVAVRRGKKSARGSRRISSASTLMNWRSGGKRASRARRQRQSEADPEVHQPDGDDGKEALREDADAF